MKGTVLILASGEHTRFGDEIPKQLLEVPGTSETIISRIVRQVEDRGFDPFAVTHKREIVIEAKCSSVEPLKRWVTSETLLSTRSIWWKRVRILLGDVIYSKACMDKVFNYWEPFVCFANSAEVFALAFDESEYGNVIAAAETAVVQAGSDAQGKLRHLYRAYCNFGLYRDEPIPVDRLPFWPGVPLDYTRDVDEPEDYANLISEIEEGKVVIDDLP